MIVSSVLSTMVLAFFAVCIEPASSYTTTSSSTLLVRDFGTTSTCHRSTSTLKPLYQSSSSLPTKSASEVAAEIEAEDASMDSPGQLPKLKNNLYDENEKFKDDEDWITENVPGKVILNEVELAAQVSALSRLEEKWRKERLNIEYDKERILGWTNKAEVFNGRFAMFFLVVGLLTELWTGVTIPGQIEEMLRVGGFIEPS